MKKILNSFSGIKDFYVKNYKVLLVFSFVLFLVLVGLMFIKAFSTGEFVKKDISLKGGVTITLPLSQEQFDAVKNKLLSAFPGKDLEFREIGITEKNLVIESSDLTESEILNALSEFDVVKRGDYTVTRIGSVLGESFFKETIRAMVFAFILMSIVVLIYFKDFVPSLFVIWAAMADILETLAVISLLNIKLSSAGVAAFLMLIGYSVDTDILLTARVLRTRYNTIIQRIFSAMKTGVTMTLTTLSALLVGFFVSGSSVIKEIMLILLIGLVFDLINTWLGNACILRLYLERKSKKHI